MTPLIWAFSSHRNASIQGHYARGKDVAHVHASESIRRPIRRRYRCHGARSSRRRHEQEENANDMKSQSSLPAYVRVRERTAAAAATT